MNTSIPTTNIDSARSEAAIVALDNIGRQLGTSGLSESALRQMLIPLYGITWGRGVLKSVTNNRPNKPMQKLRNQRMKQSEYYLLEAFPHQACLGASVFPPELQEWRILSDRFRLDAQRGWAGVLTSATFPAGRGAKSPRILSAILPFGLESLCIRPETAWIFDRRGEFRALPSPQMRRQVAIRPLQIANRTPSPDDSRKASLSPIREGRESSRPPVREDGPKPPFYQAWPES